MAESLKLLRFMDTLSSTK